MKNKIFLCTFFMLLVFTGCAQKSYPPLETVKKLELQHYLGKWYEVARYENRFEKECLGASADYSLLNGNIEVLNSCFDKNGKKIDEAKGVAKLVTKESGKLKVSFFWPFYGDYWILMLADDYRYSVVGEPSRKYFWILSRTKELSGEDRETILQKIPSLGYEPNKLLWLEYK